MVLSIKEREFPVIQKTKSEKLPEKTTAVTAVKKVIPPDEDSQKGGNQLFKDLSKEEEKKKETQEAGASISSDTGAQPDRTAAAYSDQK